MDDADIRIIIGDQGGGKTNTGVAIVIDDVCQKATGLTSPEGKTYKARALDENEIEWLEGKGIPYNPHTHFRVWSLNGQQSKIATKPNNYVIESSERVFSNFTFYGIRFVRVDTMVIIENINNRLLSNGWVVLDESILTDKRDTMTATGKMMAWFSAQSRRRMLRMLIIAQGIDMVQSRFSRFAKTRVLCTYNDKTHKISIDVNQNSKVMKPTDYYAPEYWKYFKHDDIVEVPQYRINRTMEAIAKYS